MNKPLLSICIPTYNREKQLERLLKSITCQKWFTDEVEIVVSDWPSKDWTQNMVKEYQEKYKNISYYRNDINIWMTPALLEVVEYAKWEYSRMFGSDDQMNNLALESVLSVIKKEQPQLILSTLFHYNQDIEIENSIQKNEFNTFNGFQELSSFMWSDKYNKATLWLEQHFTFMSVFCFNTNFFRESLAICIKQKWKDYLLKNYFNYIYIVYSNLETGKIVLFKDNFILVKSSNNSDRNVKWKIYKDLDDLLTMIRWKYKLTPSFKKFIRRIRFFFVTLAIGAFVRKLWLTQNKYYIFLRNIVSKLRI